MSNYDIHIVLKIFSSGFPKMTQEYFVYFKEFSESMAGKFRARCVSSRRR